MLIPSIDLMGGQAVQLRQGEEKVLQRSDVFELLEQFSRYGEVALIDLDAALDQGDNKALIKQLLATRPCRVGGGIRDLETAREYIKSGASKIIIGTHGREDWVNQLARENVIIAIDARDDNLTTHGWQKTETNKVLDLLPELASRCSEFLYTQVKKEGMLNGIDRERCDAIIQAASVPVTIAGGITSLDDIRWFSQRGANGQIGMSIYTGQLDLAESFLAQVDFEKSQLVPTVVQDIETGKVLMMAYSSRESLRQALTQGQGIYWSRSRQTLWQKGATSGHSQQLINADIDCDGDTLLFQVKQVEGACHLQRYSCFASQRRPFDLKRLESLLQQRKTQMPNGSFSSQLFQSSKLRAAKLREESEELIQAKNNDEVRWEAADLLFFTLVDSIAKGVGIEQIICELRSRFNDS